MNRRAPSLCIAVAFLAVGCAARTAPSDGLRALPPPAAGARDDAGVRGGSVAAVGYTPPAIQGHVTDLAGALSAMQRAELERDLAAWRTRTGHELAIFIPTTLEGASIETVANVTFNTWRLGRAGIDDGVLIVVAPTERRVRLETGLGLKHVLPDPLAAIIVQSVLSPLLHAGRTFDALVAGTAAVEHAVDGGPVPTSSAP